MANRNYITWRNTSTDFYDDKERGGQFYKAEIDAPFDPFYPRSWTEKLEQPRKRKKPAGIFLDDMSDWMGSYWPEEWTEAELQMMRDCPQHRFYTLTKQPQNLPQWSPFPDNCWVGVTATGKEAWRIAQRELDDIKAKVKYISCEPLLEPVGISPYDLSGYGGSVNWLIIGAQTKPYKPPKIEWVEEIELAAREAGIPIFEKNNLRPLLQRKLTQEMPGGTR